MDLQLHCLADLTCLSARDPDDAIFLSPELAECLGIVWEDEDEVNGD